MLYQFRLHHFKGIPSTATFEPPHDKTNKVACVPNEASDQPGHLQMPRLIWVFAGRTCHFVGFVTSGSFNIFCFQKSKLSSRKSSSNRMWFKLQSHRKVGSLLCPLSAISITVSNGNQLYRPKTCQRQCIKVRAHQRFIQFKKTGFVMMRLAW